MLLKTNAGKMSVSWSLAMLLIKNELWALPGDVDENKRDKRCSGSLKVARCSLCQLVGGLPARGHGHDPDGPGQSGRATSPPVTHCPASAIGGFRQGDESE